MPKTLKIIVSILTVLTGLAMIGFAVFALTIPHWGLFAVCLVLAGFVSLFVRNDYYYYFGKK